MAHQRWTLTTLLTLLVTLLASTLAVHAQTPNDKAFAKHLQGEWQGWVVNGKGERPDRGPIHLKLLVRGTTMQATDIGKGRGKRSLGQGTFKLRATRQGYEFDGVRTSTPGKGQTYLGILKLEGNVLKWCVATPRRPRPKTYETRKGQFLLILHRSKQTR